MEHKTYYIKSDVKQFDLSGSDEKKLATLEVLKVGDFDSPTHGKFKITQEMLSDAVQNFNKNVHRLKVKDEIVAPLNFSHNQSGEAAGWIKELYLSDDKTTLIAKILLTEEGKKKAKTGGFLFASAEFSFLFYDPELKQNFKNVLTGVALTNIPFMRGLNSIKLTQKIDFNMEEVLKLTANLSKEEKVILIKKLQSDSDMKAEGKDKEFAKEEESKEFSALQAEIISLKGEVEKEKKEKEFTVLLSQGLVTPAQKEAFLNNDMSSFIENAPKKDLNFSNKSGGEGQNKKELSQDEAVDELMEKAKNFSESKNISFGQAMSEVIADNKEVYGIAI